MAGPPKKLKLADVPEYLATHYNINVSRQTVYNWARTGVGGDVLESRKHPRGRYTTTRWVDDFVARTN